MASIGVSPTPHYDRGLTVRISFPPAKSRANSGTDVEGRATAIGYWIWCTSVAKRWPSGSDSWMPAVHARMRKPAIRRSRPADARLGSRTLHVTADWDLRASGAAAELFDAAMGGESDLVPSCDEPRRSAPAPHCRAAQGEVVRARHRPLPDAQLPDELTALLIQ